MKRKTYPKLAMVRDATAYLQQRLPDVETINVVLLEELVKAEMFEAESELALRECLLSFDVALIDVIEMHFDW